MANDISICIDEYYSNKYEKLGSAMSDENIECAKDGNVKCAPSMDKHQSRLQHGDISENLLGIFVVSFDTKLGNVIEWQIPESLELDRIEFKAMASGFHLMQNDVV